MSFRTPQWVQRQDPRWQQKRLLIFDRDKFTCQICGDKTRQIQVHHRWYVSGRKVWEYPDCALVTLCSKCHKDETEQGSCECVDGLEWEQFAGVLLMADGKNKGLFLANSLECFESNNKVKMDDALAVFLFAIGNNLISMEIFNSWKNEMEIFKREYL